MVTKCLVNAKKCRKRHRILEPVESIRESSIRADPIEIVLIPELDVLYFWFNHCDTGTLTPRRLFASCCNILLLGKLPLHTVIINTPDHTASPDTIDTV